MTNQPSWKLRTKERALEDLESFIQLVHPHRVLGQCHKEVIQWWTRPDASTHQLVLLPRDHQKSALIAYRVVWELTKNPALRVLYISSTANLAEKQLKFIKDIFTSPIYRYYWPEMVNVDEAKREKWTTTEISLDHPLRKQESVRDPSIFTAGLTTNIVGLHCDISVLDDVVVDDSAYSKEGRDKVANQVSYLASIAGAESKQWAVGTRYHPLDLYDTLQKQAVELYDEYGDAESITLLYEKYERQVEDKGDGSGTFLWPREQRKDGKWFGFDRNILARKKAQYNDLTKFRAQYYNDPNDLSEASITRDRFQYYDPKYLARRDGNWVYKGSRLNLSAAVDFAYSSNKAADFTAIVVVGVDSKHNYYILEIDRFKTNNISDYFDHILRLHTKWGFRKIRAEVTAAQSVIVTSLKNDYIRIHGLALSVDEHRPTKKKEERIDGVLQPKYSNMQVWHYEHGLTNLLEEELTLRRPPHDDIKDALAAAVDLAVPPSFMNMAHVQEETPTYNPKWGGIA